MMKCNPMAYARCPHRRLCDPMEDAFYMEGSLCDQFNQRIQSHATTLDITTRDLIEEMSRPSPKTEADRIRAMNDEELADFLYPMTCGIDPAASFCKNKKECEELMDADKEIPDEWCKKCLLEMLQQPAEETKLPSGMFLDKQESGLIEED